MLKDLIQEDIGLALVKVSGKTAQSILKKKPGLGEDDRHKPHTWTHEEVRAWRACAALPPDAQVFLEAGLIGMAIADIALFAPVHIKTDTDNRKHADYRRKKTGVRALPDITPRA
jgi:hypothetical protein